MNNESLLTRFLPPTIAGIVAVVAAYAGALVIVMEAFQAAGASQALVGSWVSMLGWSMALSTLGLSLWYRQPILTSWSTPGAALLATALPGHLLGEAVAIFMFCGLLILICGLTGAFARLMNRLPRSLAAAMLAGVLLDFGLRVFTVGQDNGVILVTMVMVWVIMQRLASRYAVLVMLVAGVVVALATGQMGHAPMDWQVATPTGIMPEFSLGPILGIGIPLFVVTMASQNATGIAMLENNGYKAPTSSILSVTGLLTILLAPFGGYVTCLSSITAGICMTRDAHDEPGKRYYATIAASIVYVIAGLLGGSIITGLEVLPKSLVAILAGMALLPAVVGSLHSAMADDRHRTAATLTFLVTASGVPFFGISSALWGLLVGLAVLWFWQGSARA